MDTSKATHCESPNVSKTEFKLGKMVKIPLRLDEENSSVPILTADAKFTIKLSLDLRRMMDTRKIKDKEERYRKIREIIHIDTSLCEISFT